MLRPMSTRARGAGRNGDRPAGPVKKSYITPEGAKKLRSELEQLWTVERPRVTQEVADAAAQGDRSENAEYIYGKKQLAEIDRRVRFLRKRLSGVKVVDQQPSDTTKVYFGAWFELRASDGSRSEYRLVGPDESTHAAEYISMDSPLGRAVLGKCTADTVVVRAPDGEQSYEVVGVRYR